MIGKIVLYETPESRFSKSKGVIKDKIRINGSDFYLIENESTKNIEQVPCQNVTQELGSLRK